MDYFHVDVFSARPLGGNGLSVVFPDRNIRDGALLELAREFKQFETSFIYPAEDGAYPVRIFTVDEELPFAGHPVLGSGAMIHRFFCRNSTEAHIALSLHGRKISLDSTYHPAVGQDCDYYSVTMNQGRPQFLGAVSPDHASVISAALGLSVSDLDERYPMETVSTGLPYLLVPLKSGIDRARIVSADFETLLSRFDARFVYVFDTERLECRTWGNNGLVEDSATGSAAGPLCAYLVKNGYRKTGERILLSQGRFVGRPAEIECRSENGEIFIKGDVALFAQGTISRFAPVPETM